MPPTRRRSARLATKSDFYGVENPETCSIDKSSPQSIDMEKNDEIKSRKLSSRVLRVPVAVLPVGVDSETENLEFSDSEQSDGKLTACVSNRNICSSSDFAHFVIDKKGSELALQGKESEENIQPDHVSKAGFTNFVFDKHGTENAKEPQEIESEPWTISISALHSSKNQHISPVSSKGRDLNASSDSDSENTSEDTDDDDHHQREDGAHAKTHVKTINSTTGTVIELSSALDPGLDVDKLSYFSTGKWHRPQLSNQKIKDLILKPSRDAELMKKSVLTPDLEKKATLAPYQESDRQAKKQRKEEREKTKGRGWFGLPATELTEDKKNDLMVLQMRRSLDPKRFYKAPDIQGMPKYFQTARIVETSADFYSGRIPKKQRKKSLVDELLADAEFRKYNKRKYVEIQESSKQWRGAFKHMKRMKKKKK